MEKETKIKERLKKKQDTAAGEILRRGTRGLRYQAKREGTKVEIAIKKNDGKVTEEALECFIECTGSSDPMLIEHLLAQAQQGIMASYEDQEKVAKTLSAVTTMLRGIGPKDEVEGMLAVQLTVTHNQALEYLALSMSNRLNPEIAPVAVNTATRLMRTFINLIEALIKYRNRNEANQRIRVDHVHVHQGGQAIVGSTVNTLGGRGVRQEMMNQPHVQDFWKEKAAALPLNFRNAKRCCARTRRGTPCLMPAMRNGRCKLHGGKATGAPRENKNAFKHGFYSKSMLERRRQTRLIIAEAKRILTQFKT